MNELNGNSWDGLMLVRRHRSDGDPPHPFADGEQVAALAFLPPPRALGERRARAMHGAQAPGSPPPRSGARGDCSERPRAAAGPVPPQARARGGERTLLVRGASQARSEWEAVLKRTGVAASPARVAHAYLELAVLVALSKALASARLSLACPTKFISLSAALLLSQNC